MPSNGRGTNDGSSMATCLATGTGEVADAVKAKVAAGEYATKSEAISDGLRTLLARDRAVENWLEKQVAPAYDALKSDPSRAVSANDVRAALAAEHQQATAKR